MVIFLKNNILFEFRTQLSRRKDGSRHDDSIPSREARRAVPSREVAVKSSPSHNLNDGVLESNFFRLFRGTNPQIEKGVATKTYYPQIKILERNGHVKETAVKFTADILIKAKNSSFFPES